MNHTGTAADYDYSYVDGTTEATEAERAAWQLTRMIEEGNLTAEAAIAHGALGVIYAVLAARKTLASVIGDIGDATTELETALGVLTEAVTSVTSVIGTGEDA